MAERAPEEARDQIVQELERWYFGGLTFAEHKNKTCVGEWRDILNEACSRLAKSQGYLHAIAEAVKRCSGNNPFFCDIPAFLAALQSLSDKQRGEIEELRETLREINTEKLTPPEVLAAQLAEAEAERDTLRVRLHQLAASVLADPEQAERTAAGIVRDAAAALTQSPREENQGEQKP